VRVVAPVLVALLAASCGSPAGSSGGPSPSAPAVSSPIPSVAGGPLAVLYSFVGPDHPGRGTYRLVLVGPDGKVVARASPSQPPDFTVQPPACLGEPMCGGMIVDWIPLVSISPTRVYYLDGAGTVRWLRPDGTTGTAVQLEIGSMQRAGFSVSPDDHRIAVAVVDYSMPPRVTVHLSVRDLATGTAADIFDSTSSTAVWPVGWRGNDLVLAVADAGPHGIFGELQNPYGCLLYTSPSPRDLSTSRMPSSA